MNVPDFAVLYDDDAPLSPRLAYSLWWTASVTAEVVTRDPSRADVGLPRVAARWMTGEPGWAERLAGCYAMVRDRLAVAAFPLARCTGEELALHVLLAVARASIDTGATPSPPMPLAGDVDGQAFAVARERLFRDRDLLLLFDPIFDGVEDPDAELNRRFGIGPFLHPANWFDTFPGYVSDDPLAPLELVSIEVEQGALHAAADLAARSGATGFRVYHLDDGAREWRARAEYRNVELVGEGATPHDAADALAARIVEGGTCSCGEPIVIFAETAGCRWVRDGGVWVRGCAR